MSTGRAFLADHAAHRIADRLQCGVMVTAGSVSATAGHPPLGGWVLDAGTPAATEIADGWACAVVSAADVAGLPAVRSSRVRTATSSSRGSWRATPAQPKPPQSSRTWIPRGPGMGRGGGHARGHHPRTRPSRRGLTPPPAGARERCSWPVGVRMSASWVPPSSSAAVDRPAGVLLLTVVCPAQAVAVHTVRRTALAVGWAWSISAIGASQYGIRHETSRRVMNRRSPEGKIRARDSIATSAPVSPGREQPPQRHQRVGVEGIGDQTPRRVGRDGSVSRNLRRGVGATNEHVRRHDDIDRDGNLVCRGLPGQSLDECVGHYLAWVRSPSPTSPSACCLSAAKGGNTRLHGQQRRQLHHGIRFRPHRHPTVLRPKRCGPTTACGPARRRSSSPALQRPIAHTLERRSVGAQRLVDHTAVLDLQVAGLADQDRGPAIPTTSPRATRAKVLGISPHRPRETPDVGRRRCPTPVAPERPRPTHTAASSLDRYTALGLRRRPHLLQPQGVRGLPCCTDSLIDSINEMRSTVSDSSAAIAAGENSHHRPQRLLRASTMSVSSIRTCLHKGSDKISCERLLCTNSFGIVVTRLRVASCRLGIASSRCRLCSLPVHRNPRPSRVGSSTYRWSCDLSCVVVDRPDRSLGTLFLPNVTRDQ